MFDEKVFQEFYCGECSHYIRIRLNMSLQRVILLVCPMCGHEHRRHIENGIIYENGRFDSKVVENLCPPKSACSKEPITKKMHNAKNNYAERRDGAVIKSSDDLVRDNFMAERWAELAARERGSYDC